MRIYSRYTLRTCWYRFYDTTLLWRRNDSDGVSNNQPQDCLLNRLFRRRSNKSSKLRVTGPCEANSPWPVNSPHKGPVTVTQKMFPFDNVIMTQQIWRPQASTLLPCMIASNRDTSNGSWCMGIKGEMSGTVCVTFTWYMYIYELIIAFVCFVVCSLL